jgi:hypothetical protein
MKMKIMILLQNTKINKYNWMIIYYKLKKKFIIYKNSLTYKQ